MSETLELKLLWCGVAAEDETMIFAEDEATALSHALSDCPDEQPIIGQWVCAIRDGKAMPLMPAQKWIDIGAALPVE
jgi:hypothetical protein